MDYVSILQEFLNIMLGGLQTIGTGIGGALSNMATSCFLTSTTVEGVTTYGLSTFGALLGIFAAISLGLGLMYLVYNWISSLGARH